MLVLGPPRGQRQPEDGPEDRGGAEGQFPSDKVVAAAEEPVYRLSQTSP
jgi:hypothetical protein